MKRTFTILAGLCLLIPMYLQAQSTLYSENFDSYTAGNKLGSSNPTWWVPWSGTAGGTDDVLISNEKSNSSPNSIKFNAAAAQGDFDMVLKLGNKTAGKFELTFMMYVGDQPTDGGYFNMLHILPATAEWAFSVVFDPNNDITLNHNNTPTDIGTYTKGVWNEVKISVDLDKDSAEIKVNNNKLAEWQFSIQESGGAGLKQLAGVNFYTYAGGGTGSTVMYYIDDVEFEQYGGVGITTPVPFEWAVVSPNPTQGMVHIGKPGVTEVKVFDLSGSLTGVFPVSGGTTDLSILPAGLYIGEFTSGGIIHRTRIVRN